MKFQGGHKEETMNNHGGNLIAGGCFNKINACKSDCSMKKSECEFKKENDPIEDMISSEWKNEQGYLTQVHEKEKVKIWPFYSKERERTFKKYPDPSYNSEKRDFKDE